MLTGLLQLAYNTVDSVVVGRYAGSTSLAAVGATTSIIFLLVTLFNGVSIGTNYLTARYYGAGDQEAISQTVHCSAVLSVILGLMAGVVGILFSTPLLELAGAPMDVLPLSSLYLKIYFLGIPALVAYNFGSAILRAVGDTLYPLIFMIVSGAMNVGLNLLFVIVFHLGVAGVAIATSVSQLLSAVLVIIRLCTINSICRLDLRKIRLYPDKAALMLKIGLSAGIQGIIFSIANVMIQSAVNSFGSAVIAGNSAASGLENFIHTAQNTFYQATITFTSQSLGAKRPRQAVQVFWICMGLTVGLGLVMCVLLRLFQPQLLGIYVKPADDPGPGYQSVPVDRRHDGNRLRLHPRLGQNHQPHRHHTDRCLWTAGHLAVYHLQSCGDHREPVLVLSRLLDANLGHPHRFPADLQAPAGSPTERRKRLCATCLIWTPL